jgi:hypothetical protein
MAIVVNFSEQMDAARVGWAIVTGEKGRCPRGRSGFAGPNPSARQSPRGEVKCPFSRASCDGRWGRVSVPKRLDEKPRGAPNRPQGAPGSWCSAGVRRFGSLEINPLSAEGGRSRVGNGSSQSLPSEIHGIKRQNFVGAGVQSRSCRCRSRAEATGPIGSSVRPRPRPITLRPRVLAHGRRAHRQDRLGSRVPSRFSSGAEGI